MKHHSDCIAYTKQGHGIEATGGKPQRGKYPNLTKALKAIKKNKP